MTATTFARPRSDAKKLSNTSFRRDIQGLRMVAVLVVIFDHLVGWPSGGFVGVDIFFVISGFLITGLLLREHDKTGTISFSGFYRNRIRRIAPAATLVIAVTLVAASLLFNSGRFTSTIQDSIWAFLFTANWNYAVTGTDYFEASGPASPLQHFWSLAVEEQFYFVWPWLMLAIFVLAGRHAGWGRQKTRQVIGFALGALTVASFLWSLWETDNDPGVAYFSTFSRAWELGVGALIAVFAGVFENMPSKMRQALAYAGLVGIAVSLAVVSETTAFPAPWAALPVLCTAAVIVGGTGSHETAPWLLTNRVAGYIGNISYSLYLWHFPVIVIYTSVVGETAVDLAVCALIFTAAAIYSFHLVEDPIRRSNWLSGPSKVRRQTESGPGQGYKLTALSLLAVAAMATTGTALIQHTSAPVSAVAPPVAQISGATAPEKEASPELAKLQEELKSALTSPEWPALKPSIEEVMAGSQAPEDIMWCGKNVVEESRCTWGDPNATKTIVTVGNSISMTYIAALRAAIGTSQGWKLVAYGMFGCPFGDKASLEGLSTVPEGCAERADQAVAAINRIQPNLVVMSGIQKYDSAAAKMKDITAPVRYVFLPGTPVDKDVESCYTKLSTPADCVSRVPSNWGYHEKKLAADFPLQGVFVDSLPWYCFEGSCPSFAGTVPTKLDPSHITASYAERLGPVIREQFIEQGLLD